MDALRLFRILELCLALLILSWLFTRLPLALNCARTLALLLTKRLFVFFLSNAIIATLIARSKARNAVPDNVVAEAELYRVIRTKNAGGGRPQSPPEAVPVPQSREAEEEVHDKQIIVSETTLEDRIFSDREIYVRMTKNLIKRQCEATAPPDLRRPEAENCMRLLDCEENPAPEFLYPEDRLNREEFRRTIEAFIAKSSPLLFVK